MTSSKEARAARKATKRAEHSRVSPEKHSESPGSALSIGIDHEASPGFLGSTSYLAVFEEGSAVYPETSRTHQQGSMLPCSDLSTPDVVRSTLERIEATEDAARVLGAFADFEVLDSFWARAQQELRVGLLPQTYFNDMFQSIKRLYGGPKDKPYSANRIKNELDRLFVNTSRPVKICQSMTPKDFLEVHVGDNIRWEALGLMFSNFGHAAKRIPKNDAIWSAPWMKGSRNDFIKKMLDLARHCLKLCETNGIIGFFTLLFHFEYSVLITFYYGDNSYASWANFGDLVSACQSIGLHQPSSASYPRFLTEIKKQLLANIYIIDKTISTFLGRPPRMPRKYCVLEPALDITVEELILDHSNLESLIATRDEDGWAPHDDNRRPVMARVLPSAMIREDILELSLAELPDNALEIAKNIERRCNELNQNILEHYHYNRGSRKPPGQNSTLDALKLTYALYVTHNDFLLQRVLVRRLRQPPDKLLEIAVHFLTDVLEFANLQEGLDALRADLDWVIISYGLPSAGVLALELLRQSRPQKSQSAVYPSVAAPVDFVFPRSAVIQKLSVLVSCLGWAAVPGDGNYSICRQAQQMLSRILDSVLSAPPAPVVQQPPPAPSHQQQQQQLPRSSAKQTEVQMSRYQNSSSNYAHTGPGHGLNTITPNTDSEMYNPAAASSSNDFSNTITANAHANFDSATTFDDDDPITSWSWFDNLENDGDFWNQLAEHPYLHYNPQEP